MKVLTTTEFSASVWKMLVGKAPFQDGSPLTCTTSEDLSVSLCKLEVHD